MMEKGSDLIQFRALEEFLTHISPEEGYVADLCDQADAAEWSKLREEMVANALLALAQACEGDACTEKCAEFVRLCELLGAPGCNVLTGEGRWS